MARHLSREDAFLRAVDFLKRNHVRGAAYEFGVSTGKTAIAAMNAAKGLKTEALTKYFLFDSFEGLPKPDHDGDQLPGYDAIEEGLFAVSEADVRVAIEKAGHDLSNAVLVPGFYDSTLKDRATHALVADHPAALVHIDCDMYASTRDCLNFMTGRILDGAIMLFDDWFIYRGRADKGEQKAFHEWKQRSGLVFQQYFQYHWAGMCFICNTIDAA